MKTDAQSRHPLSTGDRVGRGVACHHQACRRENATTMPIFHGFVNGKRKSEIIRRDDESLQRKLLATADSTARGSNRPSEAMTKSRCRHLTFVLGKLAIQTAKQRPSRSGKSQGSAGVAIAKR